MLSQKTKYALQAVALLSSIYDGNSPMLCSAIAQKKKIPVKFLENILCELRSGGILKSVRGKKGGYLLADHPKNISLAKIIRLIDGPIALLPCVSLNFYEPCNNCNRKTCGINPVMVEARDAVLKVLEGRTLYDIADKTLIFEEKKLKTSEVHSNII